MTGRGVKLGGVAVLQCEHSIVTFIKVDFGVGKSCQINMLKVIWTKYVKYLVGQLKM